MQLGIGSVYTKAQYRQYTDASFQTLKPRPAEDEHLGILGPLMRASVGQVLTVVLRNNLPFPVNLLPAGVQPADAAGAADGAAAAALSPEVQPGQEATYRFVVPASIGPSELEPSAKLWLYRCSTVWRWRHGVEAAAAAAAACYSYKNAVCLWEGGQPSAVLIPFDVGRLPG
jgi:hephaestin